MNSISQPLQYDFAILVLGLSGAGKSTFVTWVTEAFGSSEKPPAIRQGLGSKTSEVEVFPLVRLPNGSRIFLVDTPGFDHTYMADIEVFDKVARWLHKSSQQGTRICAVIYLQDISQEWISQAMRLDFQVLVKLCGSHAISSGLVTIATTKWSSIDLREGEQKEAELHERLWVQLGHPDLSVRRVYDGDNATSLVDGLLSGLPRELQLLWIQTEMLQLRGMADKTDAGRCLAVPRIPRGNHRWRRLAKFGKMAKSLTFVRWRSRGGDGRRRAGAYSTRTTAHIWAFLRINSDRSNCHSATTGLS